MRSSRIHSRCCRRSANRTSRDTFSITSARLSSRAMRLPLPPANRATHDAGLETTRRALGHAAFAQAFDAGSALTSDAAIDLALASAAPEVAVRPVANVLTAREVEVARLVGRGLS